MRGIRRHAATPPVAVLLAVLLACAAGWLALTRLPMERQLERWLRTQPGVTSVELRTTSALAAAPMTGPMAAQVARPDVRVGMSPPLSVDVVGRFMTAYEEFAADHDGWRPWSLDLRQGPDAVLVAGRADNAVALEVLRLTRARPEVEAVQLSLPAGFRAVVRAGADPVTTAAAVSSGLPDRPPGPSVWTNAQVVTQDVAGHEVRVERGGRPSPRAGQAFAEAVRGEGDRAVELRVAGSASGADGESVLELDASSPTAARTAVAVSALGFGMPGHRESIKGVAANGGTGFDEAAWASGLTRRVSSVPGVRAATARAARANGARATSRSVLDVRATVGLDWSRLATAVPDEVDLVEVHTAAAAPDYDRDVALPEDPELFCPTPTRGPANLAYRGPRDGLGGASEVVATIRRVAQPSCVHWRAASPETKGRSRLSVRIPFQPNQWRPLVDLLVARDRAEGPPLDGELLLDPPGATWTAALLFRAGAAPSPGSSSDQSLEDDKQAQAAVAPVIAYWRARSGVG